MRALIIKQSVLLSIAFIAYIRSTSQKWTNNNQTETGRPKFFSGIILETNKHVNSFLQLS